MLGGSLEEEEGDSLCAETNKGSPRQGNQDRDSQIRCIKECGEKGGGAVLPLTAEGMGRAGGWFGAGGVHVSLTLLWPSESPPAL